MRRLEKRAALLKALAHPVRLLLVEALRRGERCVCEFHDPAGGDFSTVSKHLKLLRRAGALEGGKRGLQVYYRLASRAPLRLLACVDQAARRAVKEVSR